jgi:hypothetical protein
MKNFWVNFWRESWEFLGPRQSYAWQTPLWLSILAWLLSWLTTNPNVATAPVTAHAILINFSWAFLIIAVGWFTTDYPFKILGQNIGPWVTGGLLCLYLFGRADEPMVRTALLSWPLVSTAIAALPDFFRVDSGFQWPKRLQTQQQLMVLLLINLLLTSWILFSFRTQDWIRQYPGLRGESFDQSLFVIHQFDREDPTKAADYSRGKKIVEGMRNELVQQALGLTRPEMERWLFDNKQNPQIFSDAVMARVAKEEEGDRLDQAFWQLETLIGEPEYRVVLRALWRGPRPRVEGHSVQLVCQITFANSNRTQIRCDDDAQVFAGVAASP